MSKQMGITRQTCALSKDKLLLFFPKNPDTEWIKKITTQYPGLEVKWVNSVKQDGSFVKENDLPVEYWKDTTLLFVDYLPPPAGLISKVRFVQLAAAGADAWLGHPTYLRKDTIFSNASGLYS